MSGPLPPRSAVPRDVTVPVLPGLGLTSFLSIGLYLALLITALLPETLAERQARLHIAGQLRDPGAGGA